MRVVLDADRARLQAAQSAAQVRKLEANYTRAKQLAAQQMVSANDLDQLKYDLAHARAVNNLANLELSYTKMVAARKRVGKGKSESVRGDLGGPRFFQNTKTKRK